MNERDANSADKAADPNRDRRDDFAGPPVTAAEVALLQKLFLVGADLACEAAAQPVSSRAAKVATTGMTKCCRIIDFPIVERAATTGATPHTNRIAEERATITVPTRHGCSSANEYRAL